MTNDPKPDPNRSTRASKLRAEIDEIVNRGKKKKPEAAGPPSPDRPDQPRSLNEVIEERMRDHVGEKKP